MQLSEYVLPFSSYFAEFLGTFFIVFTAGLLLVSDADFVGNSMWRPTGIAFVTIAAISATSAVSGSHLNPAVSLAFGMTRKIPFKRAWAYMIIQVLAGVAGSAAVRVMMGKPLPVVEPKPGYNFLDACLVEGIYSSVYCFVALNCLGSLQNNPKRMRNQFFPLAIGLVIIAGGHPASEVSGGFLNPAITISFVLVGNLGEHLARSMLLAGAQAAGAVAAAILFFLVRPEELAALGVRVAEGPGCSRLCSAIKALNFCHRRRSEVEEDSNTDDEVDVETSATKTYRPPLPARIMSEFIGTYLVVLTFGLCAVSTNRAAQEAQSKVSLATLLAELNGAPVASATSAGAARGKLDMANELVSTPYSMGAVVVSLTYALATVSGAQFNPAVTLAVMCSSRDPYVWAEAPTRILAQACGAVAAAVTYLFVSRGQAEVLPNYLPHLGPGSDFTWTGVNIGEMLFTMAVAYVVLCMTTVNSPRYPKATSTDSFDFGLAIGFTVMAGGWVLQRVSGGMMNPAISLGVATSGVVNSGLSGFKTSNLASLARDLVQYVAWQCAGGVMASFVFWLSHPLLYKPDPLITDAERARAK